MARENARHVREQISLEMWEEINRTYLSLKGFTVKKVARAGAYEFYNHIKNASALFQGTTDGTMTHGEDWDFIQIGKFLERADMTTRILDAHDEIFINTPAKAQTTGTPTNGAPSCVPARRTTPTASSTSRRSIPTRWSSSLSSTNSSRARSASASRPWMTHCAALPATANPTVTTPRNSPGDSSPISTSAALEDIKTIGMHQYMDEIQIKMNDIGEAIYKTYLFCPPRTPLEPEPEAAPVAPPAKKLAGQTQSLGGLKQKQS